MKRTGERKGGWEDGACSGRPFDSMGMLRVTAF